MAEPIDLSDARGWELAVALARLTEQNLVAAFNVVPIDDLYFEYLTANALQVLVDWRPSLLGVQVYLRRMSDPNAAHQDLAHVPFSNRFSTASTERLPRPQQKAFTMYRPMSYVDILTDSAIRSILQWLTVEHSNMVALKRFGPDVRQIPYAHTSLGFGQAVDQHDVLVIGRDQFLPPARSIIWDCRGF